MARNSRNRLTGAVLRTTATVTIVTMLHAQLAFADGSQLGMFGSALGQNMTCVIGCTALGNQSIADGNKNQQQGQQTQNMAQMAMGAMQILMGLLGLLAAMAAQQKGNKDAGNQSNLSGLAGDPYSGYNYNGTSPTGSNYNNSGTNGNGTSTSNTGASEGNPPSKISLNAADLRTGTLGAALDGLEKNYGLNRDQVLNALKNGADPKDILANAPKNAPSADMLGRIADGLAANSASKMAAGELGSRDLAALNANSIDPGGKSAAGSPAGDTSMSVGKGIKPPSSTGEEEEGEKALVGVSPEVAAALAAKAAQAKAEKEMADSHSWNLFQLVHKRYQKLETMLYGRVERTNVKGF